jgi:hypothetical protein
VGLKSVRPISNRASVSVVEVLVPQSIMCARVSVCLCVCVSVRASVSVVEVSVPQSIMRACV